MKKLGRILVAGLAYGIVAQVIGGIIYGGIFMKWTQEIAFLWRPMDSLLWKVGMPLSSFLEGILLAIGYIVLYKGIPGEGIKKGLSFGLLLFLMNGIAGELSWYSMMPLPSMYILAGWLYSFVVFVIGGILISLIYGKTLERN
jgi:hypothetical protein